MSYLPTLNLHALVGIKEGKFLDSYVGEIITSAETQHRRKQRRVTERKDVYLFALDKFSDPDSIDERLTGPCLEVDGEYMTGLARFINHSSHPNLRIFAPIKNHAISTFTFWRFFFDEILARRELTISIMWTSERAVLPRPAVAGRRNADDPRVILRSVCINSLHCANLTFERYHV